MSVFKKFQDDKQNIEFVFKQINNRKFQVLPNTIASGLVLKITYDGDLKIDGYERGFLVLSKDSSIKEHKHTTDIEQYTLLTGNLSINKIPMNINECFIGEKHSIDQVSELTIIKTIKINSKLLNNTHEKQYIKSKY